MVRAGWAALWIVLAGCHGSGGDGVADLRLVPDDAAAGGGCGAGSSCPDGSRCHRSSCIPDNGSCTSDNDCQNDTFCDCGGAPDGGLERSDCLCVPWGSAPRGSSDRLCAGGNFGVGAFLPPVESCRWHAPPGVSSSVVMTPLVIDLDLDGNPEIVFANYDDSGGAFPKGGGLFAIHGADCSPYFEKPGAGLRNLSQLAAADLDGDRFPEIVALGDGGSPRVMVFDHAGNLLATSQVDYQSFFDIQGSECAGAAIADVDGDGIPEIGVAGQVLRYNRGDPHLQVVFTRKASIDKPARWGTTSLFADLDGDGRQELVTGLKVFDGATGEDKTPSQMQRLGPIGAYPAVADFNGDSNPDILLVQSQKGMQQVTIVDYRRDRILFGPYSVAGGGWGGPATVADFDGDGVPDFGTAGPDHYYVYAMKCAREPRPSDCRGPDPGVLWERETHDVSSGGTSSSVFDFNGDGRAEVVYRDECWLRVMNGPDGRTVFAQPITSGTCLEMPVVADVNNDGHADLVVPSDDRQGDSWCLGVDEGQTGQRFGGTTRGVFVLRDPLNRWVESRRIWNQHTYHIGNVLDDGTVPLHEIPGWLHWNSYRRNVQSNPAAGKPLPDFTAAPASGDNGGLDCRFSERLWASLCNRGAVATEAGLPGAFYDADPRRGGAHVLCVSRTRLELDPGRCEPVHCDWIDPPGGARDLWFRADDDGTRSNVVDECNPDGDLLLLGHVTCGKPG